MSSSRPVKCSICSRPIKTTFGAINFSRAPVVCRRCFGDQTYATSSHWSYTPIVQDGSNTPAG